MPIRIPPDSPYTPGGPRQDNIRWRFGGPPPEGMDSPVGIIWPFGPDGTHEGPYGTYPNDPWGPGTGGGPPWWWGPPGPYGPGGDPGDPMGDHPGSTVPGGTDNGTPPRRGGGGGGRVGFPNFDPNNPYGPPITPLHGGGFMPWSPIMPSGSGMWSGYPDQQSPGFGMPGGMGGGGGFPGGGAGPFAPAPPGNPLGGGLNAFQTYQAAIPVMEQARDSQISQAMAGAGFGGNRFGSAAMKTAGQIGAATALQQNQLLANLLHDETGRTLDRALQGTQMGLGNEQFRNELALRASMGDRDAQLQAAQMGIQAGSLQDQMMQDRIRMLQGFGQAEQARQDQFSRIGLDQFNQDRLGPIPMILQALSGNAGSGGSAGQTSTGGTPGFMDYAVPIITAIIAAGSDIRLKENIRDVGFYGPFRWVEWDWRDGHGHSEGVIAQEVEELLPEAVLTDPESGLKCVDYLLLHRVVGSPVPWWIAKPHGVEH